MLLPGSSHLTARSIHMVRVVPQGECRTGYRFLAA